MKARLVLTRGHIGENGGVVENGVSGIAYLFKFPYPMRAGPLLRNSWHLRSQGQKRGGLEPLAELRPTRVGLPRPLSGPECGQYAFGISR